ncbi:MAG: bifunctional [glutamate--ammonia ligase]-adenylyl-L-tyrosine phosphorylase/[glutamate--ammonia-ligase] adenylyltransferase, partial [Luminiphilus sp.]
MTDTRPVPQALGATLERSWGLLAETLNPEAMALLQQHLEAQGCRGDFDRLLATSEFFRDQFIRHAEWAVEQVAAGQLFRPPEHDSVAWRQQLEALVPERADEAAVMSALRIFRNRQMLGIVARELTGRGTLANTFRELTGLADTTIQFAVRWATDSLSQRFGQPVGEWSGDVQELVVLGMGKLGGGELNLSSDIDLIYCYPEPGTTDGGRKSLSNQEFFIRVGQRVIKLLDAKTVDGFVFRVDMRLRPFGSSGPLVVNFNALEVYYQQHGRDWERYAMIKARAITGAAASTQPLADLKRAFVYRRYTDYGALDALRDMRQLIAAETLRSSLQDNIKRGYGGIREIEFIVQCKQLIHGGRNPELQVVPLQAACAQLETLGFISPDDREGLLQAYGFLRRLENILQGLADQQTQELPGDELTRLRLALLMGYKDWHAASEAIQGVRDRVTRYFQELVTLPEGVSPEGGSLDGLPFSDLSEDELAARGFTEAGATWEAL